MAREYRVTSSLLHTDVPVAPTVALCEDESVIGAPFAIAEFVPGLCVQTREQLDELDDATVFAVADYLVQTLAALHRVDYDAVGLSGLGRPGGYAQRQLKRWSGQWEIVGVDRLNALAGDVGRRLAAAVPEQNAASIVHGDYRIDNTIVDLGANSPADRVRVAAVVDWELSTLGDPMADFSYLLIAWVIPASLRNGLAGADLEALGIPSVEETVDRYAAATGLRPSNLDWLFAYNLFRLAAICQGIAGRVRDGTAASAHARTMAAQVGPLSDAAWAFARKAGA